MIDTYKTYPFWRTDIDYVNAALDAAKIGRVHTLCTSAGGREIRYITYGEKEDYGRTANYSSACGARDPKYYADREGKRPTILLIGSTHGGEKEGVAALMNLISLMETGKDLLGESVPAITEEYASLQPRLVIVPIYNIDGHVRCVPDSMLGDSHATVRHYDQGNWTDGTFCEWPDVKKIHPIRDVSYLGAYFNDDGINLMHDNFFAPMAEETKAMFRLADEEAPECVIGLHGGSNITNCLLQPDYVPVYTKEAVHRLALDIAERQTARGLLSRVEAVKGEAGYPPPSFNLTSALHHVCGAVSSTYESNMGMSIPNACTAEEILLHHYCLFESLMTLAWRD